MDFKCSGVWFLIRYPLAPLLRACLTSSSSSNIITDDIGPEVESITYENGNYTIKVSDTQSGIWKITNSTGDVIYKRYDGIE